MKKLNKKQLIIIENDIKTYEDLLKKISGYRKTIEKFEILEIKYEKSFDFLSKFWAGLLEGIDMKFVETVSEDFLVSYEFPLADEKDIFLSIKDKKYTSIEFCGKNYLVADLLRFMDRIIEKKIVKKTDIFCSFDKKSERKKEKFVSEPEDLYSVFLTFVLPIMLNSKLIVSNDLSETFKSYKPTLFTGDRKDIRVLHSEMLNIFNKSSLLENFYHIFKSWDNDLFSVFLNKMIFFSKYKSLQKIIAINHKDLKGAWIDFESLGIEIYSINGIKESDEYGKQGE